jgi:uncharacterized SAM-binding protein YcdF (DUF218 family)
MDETLRQAINTMWDYMQLNQPVVQADVLILLGSRDDRVANYAASLLKNGIAPICVVTGGVAHGHDLLATKWQEGTEADHFIGILRSLGVDGQRIYSEDRATNTGQNAAFGYELLRNAHIRPKSILIVTKPYMERRALATFEVQWPDRSITMHVSSVGGAIDEYCNDQQPLDAVVNIMVGDFERIVRYPKQGFLKTQVIPGNVTDAFGILKQAGYTHHLMKD